MYFFFGKGSGLKVAWSLGLHATRMQIDVLLADVSDRDERIANLTAQAAERDAIIQQMQEEFRVFQFELDSAAQVCLFSY